MPDRPRPHRRARRSNMAEKADRGVGRVVWRMQALLCLAAALVFFLFAWSVWNAADDWGWLLPFGAAAGMGVLLLALARRAYRKQTLSEWIEEQ